MESKKRLKKEKREMQVKKEKILEIENQRRNNLNSTSHYHRGSFVDFSAE